jgi:hypothetical protein
MIGPEDGCNRRGDDDLALAELTEEISRRLESGEPVIADELGENPDSVGSIRQLLPALRAMVSLSDQIAHDEGARARSQKKQKRTLSSFLDTSPEVGEVGP